MATKYSLYGFYVGRPDKRRGMNTDKPDQYIAARISVGDLGALKEIVITPIEALKLIAQLSDAVRYTYPVEESVDAH